MEKHNEHREVERLEEELRKLAVPYSSEEPGPMYWANFRVRVMERVAHENKKATLLEKIGGWVSSHAWQSGIAISAAAVLIAVVLVNPFSEKPAVSPQAPVASQIAQPPTVDPQATQRQSVSIPSQAVEAPPMLATNHPSNRTHSSDRLASHTETSDLAVASEPITDADQHVSLNDLSQPELEAVLQGLQSTE